MSKEDDKESSEPDYDEDKGLAGRKARKRKLEKSKKQANQVF